MNTKERRVYPVQIPVLASVGPFVVRLAPEEDVLVGGYAEPDYDHRPWAVLGHARITFRFGDRVRSKTVFTAERFAEEPRAEDVFVAQRLVLADLRRQIAEHGVIVAEDHPVVEGES